MHFAVVTLSLPILAAAKTIKIAVGKSGLTFDPPSDTANIGDKLSFIFYPQKHAVVAGDFSRPCQSLLGSNRFFSDFLPVQAGIYNRNFVVDVKSTDPIFFYCPQERHCQSGMVGVVNPTDSQSLAAYKKAAAGVAIAEPPPKANGGILVPNGGNGDGGGGDGGDSSGTTTSEKGAATTSKVTSTTTTSTSGDSSRTSSPPTQATQTSNPGTVSTPTSSNSSPNTGGAAGMRAGSQSGAVAAVRAVILSATLMVAGGLF